MKMAKPSAKDIAAAEELQQVLNALDQNQRWGCAALEDAPDFFQLIDDDEFDPEQDRHAQALYNKLVTLMWENPSFHNRVISGMCHVIMYEKNQIIDPDSDCIDLHPRFAEMWNNLKRETQAARYWNQRYHQVVAERDEAQAKLAAMESQKPTRYEWREIDDGHWDECDKSWYEHAQKSPELDTRCFYSLPVPADKPAEAVPDEVIRTLERIAKWHGEFPEAPPFQGKPQSYGAAYGSNGERDYMRGLAAEALELLRAPSNSQQSVPAVAEPDENPHEWIIEKLSYHRFERDDLTIDECLSYLASEWKEVRGREVRPLVMQILALLASAPSHSQQRCNIGNAESHDKELQVTIEHNGKIFGVDESISEFVQLLNYVGLETVASCSGHGHRPANIALKDGREIIIARDFDEARKIDRIFPVDINGDSCPNHESEQGGAA